MSRGDEVGVGWPGLRLLLSDPCRAFDQGNQGQTNTGNNQSKPRQWYRTAARALGVCLGSLGGRRVGCFGGSEGLRVQFDRQDKLDLAHPCRPCCSP